MENKETTKTTKTTTESKGTSRKKTGGSSASVATKAMAVESAAVETPVVTVDTEAKTKTEVAAVKKRPDLDLDENVAVYNMTPGKLVYVSKRSYGLEIEWEKYGDFQYIELRELVNMKSSQRIFFEENWVYIEDPDVREYLGITRYYTGTISPVDVDTLFEIPVDSMIEKISALSEDVKSSVLKVAIEKFNNKGIESYVRIKALEDIFNFKFD